MRKFKNGFFLFAFLFLFFNYLINTKNSENSDIINNKENIETELKITINNNSINNTNNNTKLNFNLDNNIYLDVNLKSKNKTSIIIIENENIQKNLTNTFLHLNNNSNSYSFEAKEDLKLIINSSIIDNFNYTINDIEVKYHSFERGFFSSFFRSFSLLLVSEVMDKTFIIILYFSTKLPPSKLLFFSGVSLIFMNCISIIIGYSLPFLLYRTLIEWIALISFIFLSFAYVNEAYHLDDETHEKKITRTLKKERRSKILERRNSTRSSLTGKYFLNFYLKFYYSSSNLKNKKRRI